MQHGRFGFTGEAAPRCIVRSEFWCPAARRYRRVHDYASADELYDNLVHMLHLLYFRYPPPIADTSQYITLLSLFATKSGWLPFQMDAADIHT